MNFRHFFRHSYGYSMKWEKLSHLFLNIETNWDKIKKDRTKNKAIYLDEIWRLIGVTSSQFVARIH